MIPFSIPFKLKIGYDDLKDIKVDLCLKQFESPINSSVLEEFSENKKV